jgi:hypothetical protein
MVPDGSDKKAAAVHYTVDKHPHETTDAHQTAAQVLQSDGLDPSQYDLTELRAGGPPHRYDDSDPVHIKEGATFLSLKVRGPVA